MIQVTLLNGKELAINAEFVKWVESTPDTVITFINGDKLVVREGVTEIVERIIMYRRLIANPVCFRDIDIG